MVPGPAIAQAGAMTTTPPEAPPPASDPAGDTGPRVTRDEVRDLGRLRRSTTDRKVAGVAGGLGRHLDVDPLILRVAFVVLVFFGGAGIILYGTCWLLVPEEGADRAPFHLDDRTRSIALIIVGVISALALVGDSWGAFWFPWPVAIVALVVLWLLTRNGDRQHAAPPAQPQAAPVAPYGPPPQASPYAAPAPPQPALYPPVPMPPRAPNPRKRGPILFWFTLALIALAEGVLGIADLAGAGVAEPAYPALAVAICGVMLLVGAFFGRAGGIIAVGLVAALALAGATAASEIDAASIDARPTTSVNVESHYSLRFGEQRIDLSQVGDLENLDGRTITVDGNVGSIDVTLPRGLAARVDAEVSGPGNIKLFGDEHGGFAVDDRRTVGAPGDPTITLDIELNVGEIEVTYR